MLPKEKQIPIYLEKLQALERRLPSNHPKYQNVVDEYTRQVAGYNGEKSLNYYLSFLADNKYTVLHGIRLYNGQFFFQIDILLLSRAFILILEVKNYAGTLHYDPNFNQLIRTINNKEEALPNPLTQIERQKFQLITLLNKRNLPYIPVETLAVISNPLTILKTSANQSQVAQKLILSTNLAKRLKEIESRYHENRLEEKEVRSLFKYLIKKNHPLELDILEKFKVKQNDLLTGVQCQICGVIPMERRHGRWKCPECKHVSKDAHLMAIQDYSLLISPIISNKEARSFLKLNSDDTTKRLLASLNLPHTGATKGRKYILK